MSESSVLKRVERWLRMDRQGVLRILANPVGNAKC